MKIKAPVVETFVENYEGYEVWETSDGAFVAYDYEDALKMRCGTLERMKTILLVLNKANHTGEPVQDTEEEA